MSYVAPIKDMLFTMREVAALTDVQALPGNEDATDETVAAVLEESGRFCAEVVAPLNWTGDIKPSYWDNGKVITTPGFKAAFDAFAQAGWQGVQHPQQYGGQGLPKMVAAACMEMLQAANLSFALCPLLTDGAIEALLTAGSDEQKDLYVPRLLDGRWTGTMNLTEPQAGSDLAQVRTRAVPQGDGTYRVSGQKVYITYGDHDLAENIVHLVLARTPDAPEGVKGISLFIVPKVVSDANGALGKRNDVYCASIEHKLGIKASPTCVLIFGDDQGDVGPGAVGYLIGEENRGLEYMFIMMNAARFQVGMQGIAIADRAYQKAVAYARERVQSRAVEGSAGTPTCVVCSCSCVPIQKRRARWPTWLQATTTWRTRIRTPRCASRRRPRTTTWFRWSRAGARRCRSMSRRRACRCMAAWASSRKPVRRSFIVTPASLRSMRAPRRSRRTTWSDARRRATVARWRVGSSKTCGSRHGSCRSRVMLTCRRSAGN